MASGEVIRILNVYKMLDMHTKPSDLMGIDDAYTAFCFDEACAVIIKRIKDGEEPRFLKGKNMDGYTKEYSRPSDLYKKYN